MNSMNTAKHQRKMHTVLRQHHSVQNYILWQKWHCTASNSTIS